MSKLGNGQASALLERPLTARSVILSLLLGRQPPRASAALLVRWCELFGVSDNATRVALSRMAERGEVVVQPGRPGRSGGRGATYQLAGRMLRRQAEQTAALDPPAPHSEWSGRWHLVVVDATRRSAADRSALRESLRGAHFAEVREGVWTRPDNLAVPDDPSVRDHTHRWLAVPATVSAHELTERLFAVGARAERGTLLLDALEQATGSVKTEHPAEMLPAAFIAGAASLQHIRRDPLLPAELLPREWPGDALRRQYRRYERAFSEAVGRWYQSLEAAGNQRGAGDVQPS
jgi:phenylacetic acid degradation operon negative regulatory protein